MSEYHKDVIEEMASMTLERAYAMLEDDELCQDDVLRVERARNALHEDRTFVSFAINLITTHKKKGGIRKLWRNGQRENQGRLGKFGEER